MRVVVVGKKHESWVEDGIMRYQKRLKKPFDIEWVYVSHSSLEGLSARRDESERILDRLKVDEHVILLDERGKNISSIQLSETLSAALIHRPVTLVIGGAYGVTDEVLDRANFCWSLSKLVFPHQLVRLLLVEQVYRAQEIYHRRSYHHE